MWCPGPNCRKRIPLGIRFCAYCGASTGLTENALPQSDPKQSPLDQAVATMLKSRTASPAPAPPPPLHQRGGLRLLSAIGSGALTVGGLVLWILAVVVSLFVGGLLGFLLAVVVWFPWWVVNFSNSSGDPDATLGTAADATPWLGDEFGAVGAIIGAIVVIWSFVWSRN